LGKRPAPPEPSQESPWNIFARIAFGTKRPHSGAQTFAEVQAAVAASADLKAVPSNLDPSLAGAPTEI
jgi:hypothetical protein